MRVLVTGAGRSGTSLVAGLFAAAGLDPGSELVPASESNPRGFFEDLTINRLNDSLLVPHLDPAPGAPGRRHAWLGYPTLDAVPVPDDAQVRAMARRTAGDQWCLKDPRFCFTLPAWRAVLPSSVRYVLVFRHPGTVVASLLSMAAREPAYFAGLDLTPALGYRSWVAAYSHVLATAGPQEDWLVVDYDALLDTGDVGALAAFTGVQLDAGGVQPALRRSSRLSDAPAPAEALYQELRRRAACPQP